MARSALIIGLDPAMPVTASAARLFPDVDGEVVRAGIARTQELLTRWQFETDMCRIDHGETAAAVLRAKLAERPFDCVVVGGGIRLDPELTPLLELVVDVVRRASPHTAICFNTRPGDTADAVARCFPDVAGAGS